MAVRTQALSTVPLLYCRWEFEVKDVDEVEGGVAQLHTLEPRPEIDDVALDAAGRIETVKDVLVELDGESAALGLAVLVVHGTGAAALPATAFQVRRQAQVFEHPFERELALDVSEIDAYPGPGA
jgi:hypothetical protein